MEYEERARHPLEQVPLAVSRPPAERPDDFQPRTASELEPSATPDMAQPSTRLDRQNAGPDEVSGVARDRLDGIEDRAATRSQALDALLPASEASAGRQLPDLDALTAALTSLEKQISRAGREQFKASTLAEAQRDQLNVVLEALRRSEAERDAELVALRERGMALATQARQEVARAILPAVDGLDEALRSGKRLATTPPPPAPRRSWWRRSAPPSASDDSLRGDLQAWLVGLEFVRERLLGVLAAEDIIPIRALGLPFDPQIHLAVEVSRPGPDAPSGTITAVIRQGYLIGGRVLRPAEVAVARDQ